MSQQKITEKISDTAISEFSNVAGRYGIKVEAEYTGSCLFSKHATYDFVFTLIDIQDNAVINIFKQNAPDGPCPPMESIFPTYA